MFEDFTDDTAISSSDNQDLLRVWMACKRQVSDHLLVSANPYINICVNGSPTATYEISSRSVHWMTPSKIKTLP